MKISHKVTILMTLLLLVLSGAAAFIQEAVIMPRFSDLEQRNARIAMIRVRNSIDHDLEAMQVDWGNWGELYEFVRGNNPQFAARNITPAAMQEMRADALWVFDLRGRIVLSSKEVVPTGLTVDGIISRDGQLRDDLPWRRDLGTVRVGSGLVKTNLGIMMLGSSPIQNGSGSGDSVGMFVMGRLLTPEMIHRIESRTETAILVQGPSDGNTAERLVETAGVTQVFGPYRDVYAQPVMTLRVDVPRDVTAYGRRALQIASISVLAAGIVALVLMLVLLNRLVLSPLTRVTRHAIAIGENPDLPERLSFKSQDEFGQLGTEFDRMVDRFAETRSELVDQSFAAGFAELSKGVLHNLGNALTPLGVRLDTLSKRFGESPTADMQLAVAELAADNTEPANAARRAELLEFLSLGVTEIAAMISDATGDLKAMQRQASLMRVSLSEQMQVSKSRAVVLESVRLPELIEQSLEIVPDISRRRLAVETDESLQKIGAVRVARTVLRMVLQNLIINAADAVRDSGRESGMFRVAAEIVREADKDQLHLRCDDDGVGIPQDQLERIFEKGFSTKSRDTNHGIGLHWCANAVLSLGGRIWASSEGPGRGASLPLLLPLGARTTGSMA